MFQREYLSAGVTPGTGSRREDLRAFAASKARSGDLL